jgi:hypothetical protein
MAARSKLIAINAGLAAGLVLVAWQGRVRWEDAQAERRANLNVPVKRVTPPPMAPAPKPEPVQAARYADVAAKNLFSKDRNPNVVVEAPKVEPPKVMPPLPLVYGVGTLPSGTYAFMAERSGGGTKSVRVGDTIGDFKVLAMNSSKVTFEWDGKQLERNVDDLADHSGAVGSPGARSGPAAPPPIAAAPSGPPTSAAFGRDIGTPDAPAKACTANDNSPVGTIIDGYKKNGVMTPFGPMGCSWVPNK